MSKGKRTVRDFMTPAPHAIEPHESVELARQRMRQFNVLHLPVRAAGKPVGILAERDLNLLAGLARQSLKGSDLKLVQVADVMTPDPYCVLPDAPLAEVAATMARTKIGSALVVDGSGALVGIFTVNDALRALSESMPV